MEFKDVFTFAFRYLILLFIAVFGISIFYTIFTPATVYPVLLVLKFLYGAILLKNNMILFEGHYAQIIPACVAGAAYFLLLALNLVTPMSFSKRIKSIITIFLIFLGINILRILTFSILLVSGFQYFDVAHQASWYLGSTLLVILVWFANVKIFNIKSVPVYTDIKRMLGSR